MFVEVKQNIFPVNVKGVMKRHRKMVKNHILPSADEPDLKKRYLPDSAS